jgi:hypothetical protein
MNASELRDLVLSEHDITTIPVATPEWPSVDGHIYVRLMSALQRERYLRWVRPMIYADAPSTMVEGSQIKLAAITMCDEHGELLCQGETDSDREAFAMQLGTKSYVALQRVIDVAAELNGLATRSRQDAKNALSSSLTSGLNTV